MRALGVCARASWQRPKSTDYSSLGTNIVIVSRHGRCSSDSDGSSFLSSSVRASSFSSSSMRASSLLPLPTILYSSNHLLAVHKPAGWQSVPNLSDAPNNPKCLVTYLKSRQTGGGSDSRFLLPLHRLDQPVTGLLLLGKTSKAASRIQSSWKQVRKDYYCVLQDADGMARLQEQSSSTGLLDLDLNLDLNTNLDLDGGGGKWRKLSGYMLRHNRRPSNDPRHYHRRPAGWSVQMVPYQEYERSDTPPPSQAKLCSLQWRLVSTTSSSLGQLALTPPLPLLHIQTDQGARHMIRALLASVDGCSIAGDLRYGATKPLPDQSVALHAHRLQLPAQLKLGRDAQRDFLAPLPATWETFFRINEHDITCSQL